MASGYISCPDCLYWHGRPGWLVDIAKIEKLKNTQMGIHAFISLSAFEWGSDWRFQVPWLPHNNGFYPDIVSHIISLFPKLPLSVYFITATETTLWDRWLLLSRQFQCGWNGVRNRSSPAHWTSGWKVGQVLLGTESSQYWLSPAITGLTVELSLAT